MRTTDYEIGKKCACRTDAIGLVFDEKGDVSNPCERGRFYRIIALNRKPASVKYRTADMQLSSATMVNI